MRHWVVTILLAAAAMAAGAAFAPPPADRPAPPADRPAPPPSDRPPASGDRPPPDKDKPLLPPEKDKDKAPPPDKDKPPPLDPLFENSNGMKLMLIPAGKFTMGSPTDEKGRYSNEGPQHEAEITQPFYLGVYPVTRGQFAAFVKDDGYQTEAEKAGTSNTWRKNQFFDQTDDDPVVEVSWNDAVKYCQWLNKKEVKKPAGMEYGLPTEAEWEYACRAGTTTAYSFGDDPKKLSDYAWYGDNSGARTHPVSKKKPNPWGLYDMHGHVWQWCADGYDKYRERSIKDPKGEESANSRVQRGGSWQDDPQDCRSASRVGNDPGLRNVICGFRVALRPGVRTP